jgi:hypothetical protein
MEIAKRPVTVSVFLHVLYLSVTVALGMTAFLETEMTGTVLFTALCVISALYYILRVTAVILDGRFSPFLLLLPAARLLYLVIYRVMSGIDFIITGDRALLVLLCSTLVLVLIENNSRWRAAFCRGGRSFYFALIALFFISTGTIPLSWLEETVPFVIRSMRWDDTVAAFRNAYSPPVNEPVSLLEAVTADDDEEAMILEIDKLYTITGDIRRMVGEPADYSPAEQVYYSIYQEIETRTAQRTETALARISSLEPLTVRSLMDSWFYTFYTDWERELLLSGPGGDSTQNLVDLLKQGDRRIALELRSEQIRYEDMVARVDFFDDNALDQLAQLEREHRRNVSEIVQAGADSKTLDMEPIAKEIVAMHELLRSYLLVDEVNKNLTAHYNETSRMLSMHEGPVLRSTSGNGRLERNPYATLLGALVGLLVIVTGFMMLFAMPGANTWKLLYMLPISSLAWLWIFTGWIPWYTITLACSTVLLVLIILVTVFDISPVARLVTALVRLTHSGWIKVSKLYSTGSKKAAVALSIAASAIPSLAWAGSIITPLIAGMTARIRVVSAILSFCSWPGNALLLLAGASILLTFALVPLKIRDM